MVRVWATAADTGLMSEAPLFTAADWRDPSNREAALGVLLDPVRLPFFLDAIHSRFGGRRARILDVGAGGGLVAEPLAAAGHDVVAVDSEVNGLVGCRSRRPGASMSFAVADAHQLPFAAGAFDVVVASEVLEHVDRPDAVIHEAARVLAHGGLFLFSGPNRTWWSWFTLIFLAQTFPPTRVLPPTVHEHRRFLTPGDMRRMCDAADLEPDTSVGVRIPARRLPSVARSVWRVRRGALRLPDVASVVGLERAASDRLAYLGRAIRR